MNYTLLYYIIQLDNIIIKDEPSLIERLIDYYHYLNNVYDSIFIYIIDKKENKEGLYSLFAYINGNLITMGNLPAEIIIEFPELPEIIHKANCNIPRIYFGIIFLL